MHRHPASPPAQTTIREFGSRRLRVSLVEPGVGHHRADRPSTPRAERGFARALQSIERLAAGAIADIIEYVITRPAHLAINEVMVLPADQEW
jgi:NADP-dependent 3-hydroxy acid dehydrogenase YdfG